MEQFYYRRLDVYQNAKELAISINEVLKSFPSEERFALCAQLRRASTSVMFNIAEAFGRYGSRERVHFLEIANGSLMETSSELELACAYHYISPEDLTELDKKVLVIVKQLAKLIKSVNQTAS